MNFIMSLKGSVLFSIVLLVFVLVLAGVSLPYNSRARAVPLIICLTLVCFLLAQATMDARTSRIQSRANEGKKPSMGKQAEQEVLATEGKPLSLWRIYSWMIGLIIGLAFINYLIVVPLFTFLFIWKEGNTRITNALAIALGSGLFYYLVFSLFLDITLPR